MNFKTIKMKIVVVVDVCTQPAVSDRGAPGKRGQQSNNYFWYKWKISSGISKVVGTNSRGSGGKTKVCESCGTVGNSDPLPHSAGTGGLHVGYQQNRRRRRAAKPII